MEDELTLPIVGAELVDKGQLDKVLSWFLILCIDSEAGMRLSQLEQLDIVCHLVLDDGSSVSARVNWELLGDLHSFGPRARPVVAELFTTASVAAQLMAKRARLKVTH